MKHESQARQNHPARLMRGLWLAMVLASLIAGLGLARPGTSAAAGVEQMIVAAASCTNAASFVADVTVPDNTPMAPGASFVKTWRLRNAGTCTWGQGYVAAFASGARMGAASPVALPAIVYPGSTVDISIPMIAPTTPGTYRGNWLLRSNAGVSFGLGSPPTTPFYVQIIVRTSTPTPAPAQRITFQPGAISASVSMQLVSGVPKAFVLGASAGQTMSISMARPITSIAVQSPSGQTLWPTSQGSASTGPWTYQLPATGDYRITVTGSGSNTMVVTIPPGSPTPTPAAAQRITFQAGATSASVSMQLTPGQPKRFVIRAGAGQWMTLTFDAPVGSVNVRAPGGNALTPYYSDGSTMWQYYLTLSGDYTIIVNGSGPRWMTVEIPPA